MNTDRKALEHSYNPWLHRYALLVAFCTFLLVLAGGLVTSTDSGLAVPDWPLSYGQVMPPMVGGIFYEHGHRMVATLVGFLTTILAILLWRLEPRRWVRTLGLIALGAVVLQGILGGLTVLFLLPTMISVSHATLAQLFFTLTVFISLVTSRSWIEAKPTMVEKASEAHLWGIAAAATVLVQLILGAFMRHTGSGLAIPDFPLSYGGLWPFADAESVNAWRTYVDLPPVESAQIAIHFLHRLWAVVTLCVVLGCGRHMFKRYRFESALTEPSLVLGILIAMQFLLGALTVWTGRNIEVATAHVGVGALTLATSAILSARSFRLLAREEQALAPALATESAV